MENLLLAKLPTHELKLLQPHLKEVSVSRGTLNQTEVKIAEMKIRFLNPDVAIVDRFEEATGQRGIETKRLLPPRRIHLTLIMKRTGDKWLMAYYSAAIFEIFRPHGNPL